MSAHNKADLLGALVATLGRDHVLQDEADLARYAEDGRGPSDGRALAAIRPANVDQLVATLRLARTYGVRVVVQGARTGLAGAGLPLGSGQQIILSLERIAHRIDIDPLNRTATVDAGVTLSALNKAAAEHGLFFPIDLGADPSIGGMIAANTGGARLLRYGDVRHNLLALDVVVSDGDDSWLSLGKPIWKDSAGLDLKQLIVGSAGSLGVVIGATVALQPIPQNRVSAMVALADADVAPHVLVALEARLGALLTAFEGISRAALGATFAHLSSLRNPFRARLPDYALLVELSAGGAIEAEQLEEILAGALAPFMCADEAPVEDVIIDRSDYLWAIRHAVPEGLRAAGTVIPCDIAMRRGDVMRFRREATEMLAAEAPDLKVYDFGHVGDGGLHFNMVWPYTKGPMPAGLADHARALVFALVVESYGGTFSAEHGIGPRNAEWYARFTSPAERALAGRVQHLLAPEAIGRVDFSGERAT
ncbi:MAG: hypothetical protein JWR80_10120 [Bradyrhizobium sp.]|nr:hypothetical protein [Bradyrhizobium sp.]